MKGEYTVKNRVQPTQKEIVLRSDELIVSKTDTKGRITYGNQVFIEYSGYPESKLLGVQHNIVRHPDMPRGIFHYLWQTISSGSKCFAYVKNLSQDGGFYWVFATVTPDFGTDGEIIGYFSVRRKPRASALEKIQPIYRKMLEIERNTHASSACDASIAFLVDHLQKQGVSYDKFVLEIGSEYFLFHFICFDAVLCFRWSNFASMAVFEWWIHGIFHLFPLYKNSER